MRGSRRVITPLVERLITSELRKAFHAVRLLSDVPRVEGPVVLASNHHSVHDGFALWYLARRILNRRVAVWMEAWDRFPFFAAAGALPFPSADAAERSHTVRRTRALFTREPSSALVYFPEGRMHPGEEGILPWDAGVLPRVDRLLGGVAWCPVAIHSSWRENDRPELFLLPGEPRPAGHLTPGALEDLLTTARTRSLGPSRIILRGKRSVNERDFRRLAGYFRKRL